MSVGPDRVCAIVARTRHKMMQVELQEAAKRGWKFLEVRLDFLAKAVDYKRLAPMKGCAWMATIRRPADGGRWPATEAERQMVLRQAVVAGCFDWVDLETDVADSISCAALPWATTRPPCLPAPGPKSMTVSARRMVSSSCSTTTSVLPSQ